MGLGMVYVCGRGGGGGGCRGSHLYPLKWQMSSFLCIYVYALLIIKRPTGVIYKRRMEQSAITRNDYTVSKIIYIDLYWGPIDSNQLTKLNSDQLINIFQKFSE